MDRTRLAQRLEGLSERFDPIGCGNEDGPGAGLRASPNIAPGPPEVPKSDLLLPGALGSIPISLASAWDLYQGALKNHKGKSASTELDRNPLGGKRARQSKPTSVADFAAFFSQESASAMAGTPGPSGRVEFLQPEATSGPSLTFNYGEVSFPIDIDWWVEYATDERWSSRDEAMDVLWKPFYELIPWLGADWSDLDTLRGCFNCTTEPSEILFWNAGYGAPHEVYLHALQLMAVFGGVIDDLTSHTVSGQGFKDAVANILRGRTAIRHWKHAEKPNETINVRFHFVSFDPDGFKDTRAGVECGAGYDEALLDPKVKCPGEEYNFWTARWVDGTNGLFLSTAESQSASFKDWPAQSDCLDRNDGTTSNGYTLDNKQVSYARVLLRPDRLYFDGVLCDFLMFWARYAYDYWKRRPNVRGDYLVAAERLAQHALLRIVQWSRLMIHELGHVYNAHGHCATKHCFMNHAGTLFACRVRAQLGLEVDPWELVSASACEITNDTGCSTEKESYGASCTPPDRYHSHDKVFCSTTKAGQPYGGSQFCMLGCQECEYSWDFPEDACGQTAETLSGGLLYCKWQ